MHLSPLLLFFVLYLNAYALPNLSKFGTENRKRYRLTESLSNFRVKDAGEPPHLPGEPPHLPVEPPLLIGSFNIQTLGRKKFSNQAVMDIVKKVILRYDLIFVSELMDDRKIPNLLMSINRIAPKEGAYNVTLSEKRPETQEQYAYFYRMNKLKVIKQESYDDPENFYRKPFVVIFEAFTLRDMQKFGTIGHHVKPAKAVSEINALADVYDYVARTYDTKDVLLMGDFNADCSYVKEGDWDNISLWTRPEFTWAITSNMDTTTNYRSCTLDRFVYAGENMNNGVILSSARVFNFQEEFKLNIYETRNVSDHQPIELKIRGKMSDPAEKHLIADLCFTVRDARKMHNISDENLISIGKKSSFDAIKTVNGVILTSKSIEENEMLTALKKIRSSLPNVVCLEMEHAVEYKIRHGSLTDDSSFADIFEPGYKINVLAFNEFTEVSICRKTSIN